ncbi:MAG: radical SAM protein [Planctomycetes bacterium]|nr:radical SAM protein [Planctomycetota bacterium]
MSVLGRLFRGGLFGRRHEMLVVEVTQRCNHACAHCYNVWKADGQYPTGELGTEDTLTMLGKLLDESRATSVALSGGEPLLREDLGAIVDFLAARRVKITLLTNGSLLDDAAIARFGEKVGLYEIPLLSADRTIHDGMVGSPGAFDRATLAIAAAKAAGRPVVGAFVATSANVATWAETAKVLIALGADGIMFNRFNPGGEGLHHLDALMAPPSDIAAALDEADALIGEYGVSIGCSIPMPPCLFELGRWKRLSFGFCPAGTAGAYYTLDPLGHLRPCNHSPTILGNIRKEGFWSMVDSPTMAAFTAARPAFCAGCAAEASCQGSCKAAAEAACGSAGALDPYVAAFAPRRPR